VSDLVLENERLVDETRNPWFVGDVGIEDNMIVEVGRVGRISHVLVNRTKAVESGARMGTEKGKVIGKENR
jgi:N-acyl-D-aspartate/D-glutamate deacylase